MSREIPGTPMDSDPPVPSNGESEKRGVLNEFGRWALGSDAERSSNAFGPLPEDGQQEGVTSSLGGTRQQALDTLPPVTMRQVLNRIVGIGDTQ